MNLGTALVSLLLVVIVAAIIWSIVKDKRAGKNVGCGSCKSCAHLTSSHKTSHASSAVSCPSCANVDKMLADIERAYPSANDRCAHRSGSGKLSSDDPLSPSSH